MPRKQRMYLPGIPAHIVQRGNNREPCFFAEDDYRFYLERLSLALIRHKVKLHAYVLMTNHVHLLMSPSDTEGISRVMSLLGQHYVQYINKTYQRTGTLWEGRHKASLVQADNYLLHCYRYIELNPVRAGMVDSPEAYPWSSCQHHVCGDANALIEDHEVYASLGLTNLERQEAYRAIIGTTLDEITMEDIRVASHYNYPLGNERFKEKIEATLRRQVGHAKRGRPKNGVTD